MEKTKSSGLVQYIAVGVIGYFLMLGALALYRTGQLESTLFSLKMGIAAIAALFVIGTILFARDKPTISRAAQIIQVSFSALLIIILAFAAPWVASFINQQMNGLPGLPFPR